MVKQVNLFLIWLIRINREANFDLSQVKPKDQRITVFYVTGSNLYLKGFDVIGTQVTITGHTQSECFRIVKGANNNKFEDLRTHDGMAIGFYLLGGSNNHILNCDAYNNYDSVSEGGKGAMLMVLAVTLTHLQLAKAKAREMCSKDVAHGTIVMMVSI